MVSIGIVAILSALAVTAYAGYSGRAAASEGIRLAESAETAAESSYADSGTWPMTDQDAGYATQGGRYVQSVHMDGNGNIVVEYRADAPAPLANTGLYFQAWLGPDGQTVVWSCGNIAAPPNFAANGAFAAGPGTALGTGGPVSTTPASYLPKTCHT